MSNKGGVLNFEEALETGVSGVKQAGKGAAKAATDVAQAATSQVGVPMGNDKATEDIVKGLYEKTDDKKNTGSQSLKSPTLQKNSQKPLTPEEQAKMKDLRQKLHYEVYYNPLVNPQRRQEERPAEKVEKEKQQEMIELEEKKKDKPPALVEKAKFRVEKFPGGGG